MSATTTQPRRTGLNLNSGISVGIAVLIISAALWVRDGQTKGKDEILSAADQRYASRESLEAKYSALNELVNARVTVLTERVSSLNASVADMRGTVSTLPDVLAAVHDIQRQLDRIEKDRK